MSAKIIILQNNDKTVYQLKITLRGVTPPIWRRIQIKSNSTLYTLHNTIQEAMVWTNSHLHDFSKDGKYYGMVEEGIELAEGTLNERKHIIADVLKSEGDMLNYIYDFGDGWRHEIALEKILKAEEQINYPICIAGKRSCPIEDSGGSYGYMEMLKVLSDPKHEEYEECVDWAGEDYDPEYFNKDEINEILLEISKNPNYVSGFGEEL